PIIARIREATPPAERASMPPQLPPRTPASAPAQTGPTASSAAVAVSGSRERVHQCLIAIDARAEFPGARAALVLRRLEMIGRILSTHPEREMLHRPEFDGAVTVALATERPRDAILAAVNGLLDLRKFEVRDEPEPEPPPTADPAEGQSTVRIPTSTLDG